MTLTEFLLARIGEDERQAQAPLANASYQDPVPSDCWPPERVLAECEAKRRIVAEHVPSASHRWCFVCTLDEPPPNNLAPYPCTTLRALAQPYADHPDYREEWA